MRRLVVLLVALAVVVSGLFFATGSPGTRAQGSAEANKDLVRQMYAAYNAGDWNALDKVAAADVVDHNPAPGQAPGLAGVKQTLMGFRAAFPGNVIIDDLVAEGDKVTDRVHLEGTHAGEFFGVPATGKPVTLEAIEIWRIKDGKIVEGWHVEDLLGVLIQIGALPAPGGPAASSAAATPTAGTPTP